MSEMLDEYGGAILSAFGAFGAIGLFMYLVTGSLGEYVATIISSVVGG